MTATLTAVACPLCGGADAAPERELNGFALVRCRRCALVFASPRLSDAALTELYATNDTAWLVRLYSCIASRPVIDGYNRTLDKLERLAPGKGRLLDVGCAAGYFFEQAQKRGWEAEGTDLGAWAVEAARARGLRGLHVGALADLRFPDARFDVVYAAQILEHLTDPRGELAEVRRILKPGGLLHLDVPSYRTLPILLGRDDFMMNEPPQHINYFTPRTLRALLAAAGFRNVRVTSAGGLKWENLVGRPIKSDIAAAYRLAEGGGTPPPGPAAAPPRPPVHRRALAALKRAAVAGFVRPVLYDRLKLGMNLVATARRD